MKCRGEGFVGPDCKCWCKGPSIEQPAVYCDTKKPVAGGITVGPRPTTKPGPGPKPKPRPKPRPRPGPRPTKQPGKANQALR